MEYLKIDKLKIKDAIVYAAQEFEFQTLLVNFAVHKYYFCNCLFEVQYTINIFHDPSRFYLHLL